MDRSSVQNRTSRLPTAPRAVRWPGRALLVEASISGRNFARDLTASLIGACEPRLQLIRAHQERIADYAAALRSGRCMPIGSPGFVRACMGIAGIEKPEWQSRPRSLASHMKCRPLRVTVDAALGWTRPVFIAPVVGRPFQAFVLPGDTDDMTDWDRTQFELLWNLPQDEPVLVCRDLPIVAEWRYYLLNGRVLGYAPVEPSGQAQKPEAEDVSSIIAAAPQEGALALDIAVLTDGTAVLSSVLDAWEAEYYPFGQYRPRPLAYLQFLWWRWSEMLDSACPIDEAVGLQARPA